MKEIKLVAVEHEAPKDNMEHLKEMVKRNKGLHYQLTDKDRQLTEYEIRYNNKQGAINELKELTFLMNSFNDNEVPEWFTRQDLAELTERVENM